MLDRQRHPYAALHGQDDAAEANAVNVIASYLAAQPTRPPEMVIQALWTSANRAHNRIQTGWDENAVARHWRPEASASQSCR